MKKVDAPQAACETAVVTVRRLKKNGSLPGDILDRVTAVIQGGGIMVMPIDRVYGIVGLAGTDAAGKVAGISGLDDSAIIRMIPSFRMLDDIAFFSKVEYDFLHRVWPGEVVVRLRRRMPAGGDVPVPVFIPRLRFFHDLLERLDSPLLFAPGLNTGRFRLYRGADIVRRFRGHVDFILIIEEFCRAYPLPSVVDLSGGSLVIVNEGRMAAEEIKSLYFLGSEDDGV